MKEKELLVRAERILAMGSGEEVEIVQRCIDNEDWWGLEWALKNTTPSVIDEKWLSEQLMTAEEGYQDK